MYSEISHRIHTSSTISGMESCARQPKQPKRAPSVDPASQLRDCARGRTYAQSLKSLLNARDPKDASPQVHLLQGTIFAAYATRPQPVGLAMRGLLWVRQRW